MKREGKSFVALAHKRINRLFIDFTDDGQTGEFPGFCSCLFVLLSARVREAFSLTSTPNCKQ